MDNYKEKFAKEDYLAGEALSQNNPKAAITHITNAVDLMLHSNYENLFQLYEIHLKKSKDKTFSRKIRKSHKDMAEELADHLKLTSNRSIEIRDNTQDLGGRL